MEAIKMIEADHKRARVYFYNHAVTLSSSLRELEMRLPADLFVRANRAQILNTSYVAGAEELPHGMLRLVLQEGFHGPILLSRRRAVLFRQRCLL
ncbi:MAG: LytTR family transcriptional regulator [Cytophagales bacterium]|nr:LytTR family transcriptional regulator [Cytophagales bacterium]